MKHKTGFVLLCIGGIMMIISSAVGSTGIFQFLYNVALNYVSPQFVPLLTIIMTIIKFIADSGGFSIIAGAILIMLGAVRIGKFIIWVGLTFGTIALIIWIIVQIVNLTGIITDPQILTLLYNVYGFFTYNTGLAFLGVSTAIVGKHFVRSIWKEKDKEKEVELAVSSDNEEEINDSTKLT